MRHFFSASERIPVESTDGRRTERGVGSDGREVGETSSQGDTASPDVHVEAVVGALELVLHTAGLAVAEMRVNSQSLSSMSCSISIRA